MTTTTELFDWQLQVLQPKKLPLMTDKDQLTPVTFELYPEEVLVAAHKSLGEKVLSQYSIEIYKQGKLDNWLKAASPKTLLDTGVSETVFLAYAKFHQARIDESEAVMNRLRKMMGVE
jgi:hypothetical protein